MRPQRCVNVYVWGRRGCRGQLNGPVSGAEGGQNYLLCLGSAIRKASRERWRQAWKNRQVEKGDGGPRGREDIRFHLEGVARPQASVLREAREASS